MNKKLTRTAIEIPMLHHPMQAQVEQMHATQNLLEEIADDLRDARSGITQLIKGNSNAVDFYTELNNHKQEIVEEKAAHKPKKKGGKKKPYGGKKMKMVRVKAARANPNRSGGAVPVMSIAKVKRARGMLKSKSQKHVADKFGVSTYVIHSIYHRTGAYA